MHRQKRRLSTPYRLIRQKMKRETIRFRWSASAPCCLWDRRAIGLVEYTLTHHTRQSAVGLPILKKKNFGGKEYTVTEYTMSEIIASVYQCMEQQQVSEGILFLDEINCVSETLAPTMLQFLQNKTFGTHRLPPGWVIVAAGNPERYNKSVREFDMVTLDRVRSMEIEADYKVWRAYAQKRQIHTAVLAYLDLKQENFYQIREKQEGSCFVTARGWEDLSRILQVYEELEIPVTKELAEEYIRDGEIAADFAGFYQLCRKYEKEWEPDRLFSLENRENPTEKAKLLEGAGLDEKLLLMNGLEQGLTERVKTCLLEKAYMNGIYEELARIKKEAAGGRAFDEILAPSFPWLKETFYRETLKLKRAEEEVKDALEYSITFMKEVCAKGQELALFLTHLSGNEEIMAFIRQHGCETYLKEGEILLASEAEEALKKEIQDFQKQI